MPWRSTTGARHCGPAPFLLVADHYGECGAFVCCSPGRCRDATLVLTGRDTLTAVKVAIVAESFLPRVNGVTNSVCQILDHLASRGHDALVVAPAPGPERYAGFPVSLVPSVALPWYRSFTVGVPSRRVTQTIADFEPDVVHVASPMVLGASGLAAARTLGVPAVAVFQTDVAGFARRYGMRGTDRPIWSWLRRLHAQADLTLVPSTPTMQELEHWGIPRLALWRRGVDQERFHPRHRCPELRSELAPNGEVLVGYVGRLAAEKQPGLLAHLADLPGLRLVVVGDGPELNRLRRQLPNAVFAGFRSGAELSKWVASLDVFVHTGANETFCQAVQEGLSAGLPVVAPAAGGPLDLVRPGETGFLFKPDDGEGLRAAVAALVEDTDGRRRMGQRARQSVAGRSWSAVCDELLGHYAAVAAGAALARSAA